MDSIQQHLQKAKVRIEREESVTVPIPGYANDDLIARYRPLEWEDVRRYTRSVEDGATAKDELEAIADGLVAANVGMEARINGETTQLPHKLGKALTDYLGIDGAINDRTAVFLLFDNDSIALVSHWKEVGILSRISHKELEERLKGESPAS